MSFSIVKSGLLDTVQDPGRPGYANWGIGPGGVMDPYAAQVANMLTGNCLREAVIEMHFPAPQILFEQNALIAITGADFSPMLNDEPLPLWQPVAVRRNTVLHFPQLKWGARCYLSLHGGFHAANWLGSVSTDLKTGNGGYFGRPLKKGDEIEPRESPMYFAGLLNDQRNMRKLPWKVDTETHYQFPHEIRVITGREWQLLTEQSRVDFLENNFTIHPSSDRMGYQIKGPAVFLERTPELVSSAINFGSIQLLAGGRLLLLMADHQTAGAFPRIAHVITADIPKLSQLRPSDCIQFKLTEIEMAERLLEERHKAFRMLQRNCMDHLKELLS